MATELILLHINPVTLVSTHRYTVVRFVWCCDVFFSFGSRTGCTSHAGYLRPIFDQPRCTHCGPNSASTVLYQPSINHKCCVYIDGNLINRASEYTHLGHIISANLDDSCEILSKRNSLCGKINNVLCYFRNRNPWLNWNFYVPTVAIFTAVYYGSWHILLWKTFVLLGAKGTAYPHSFWFSCTFVWFAALEIWVGLSLFKIHC